MAPIKVPPNLPELVKTAFNKAKASGDLTYFPTQVAILRVNSIPFQLRFSPALANKPKPPPSAKPSKPTDPFTDPHPALLVASLEPAHYLVLNKFAVVPEHFILATTAFAEQTHLLGSADLDAAYACIRAYDAAGEALFAFYNSGAHSGASQAHRHLQLLPVEEMRRGLEDGEQWEVLAEKLGEMGREVAPFGAFVGRLEVDTGPEELRDVYLTLYREACVASGVGDEEAGRSEGEAAISYNMAMTRATMVVCPRVADGGSLHDASGEVVGKVELNGTLLAGTALVKNQAEWDALRDDPEQLKSVLGKIGILSKAP